MLSGGNNKKNIGKRRDRSRQSVRAAHVSLAAGIGCAVVIGLAMSLPAGQAVAQQVYKCRGTAPDGSVTTTFSTVPCAPDAARVHVGARSGMVYDVGSVDRDIEVRELLSAVEAELANGVRSAALRTLQETILAEVERAVEQARSARAGAAYRPDAPEIPRKLAGFPDETADIVLLAVLEACQDGARQVCVLKERVSAALQAATLRQQARRKAAEDPQLAGVPSAPQAR